MNLNPFKKSSSAEATEDEKDLKVKDLKSENRKKRVEPPKPWGKFERMIVLIAIIFTVSTALLLILYSKGYRFPKLEFNGFTLLEEKTIIIE